MRSQKSNQHSRHQILWRMQMAGSKAVWPSSVPAATRGHGRGRMEVRACCLKTSADSIPECQRIIRHNFGNVSLRCLFGGRSRLQARMDQSRHTCPFIRKLLVREILKQPRVIYQVCRPSVQWQAHSIQIVQSCIVIFQVMSTSVKRFCSLIPCKVYYGDKDSV